jgi:hypothetical protein
MDPAVRPGDLCRALLAALEASEGRRRRRKRDQTPDAIGLSIKRELLEQVVKENPGPEAFEEWLMNYCSRSDAIAAGSVSAMARSVYDEWRLAQSMDDFKLWLDRGAPSDDGVVDLSTPRENRLGYTKS